MKLFRNILALFVNNWKLKLIALLLAIVIYHGDRADRARAQDLISHDRPLLQFR